MRTKTVVAIVIIGLVGLSWTVSSQSGPLASTLYVHCSSKQTCVGPPYDASLVTSGSATNFEYKFHSRACGDYAIGMGWNHESGRIVNGRLHYKGRVANLLGFGPRSAKVKITGVFKSETKLVTKYRVKAHGCKASGKYKLHATPHA